MTWLRRRSDRVAGAVFGIATAVLLAGNLTRSFDFDEAVAVRRVISQGSAKAALTETVEFNNHLLFSAWQSIWWGLGGEGEARAHGMFASMALSPNKATRAGFNDGGGVSMACREACFENGLVMRAVGDRMIISPPLIITPDEIDTLVDRATTALDVAHAYAKAENLM